MTAALFLIGAAAAYNWVISPHVGYLHAVQRLEPVMDRMAQERDAIGGTRDEKLSKLGTLEGEMAAVREEFFTREGAKTFIHDLQALVENAGCTMVTADFTRQKKTDTAADPNLPFLFASSHADLKVVGDYGQIIGLFQSLREQRQKIQIDFCRMDLLDPRSGRLECRLGLTICTLLPSGELPQ